ncbi:MAG: Rpn family recombination-promoting nuclease/putative transposase [Treponemataceae bacterium]
MSLDNLLDPKTDWVFKLMFTKGEKGNKALISFLNAFLADTYGEIKTADVLNTEIIRDSPNAETYRLDLLVKTDNRLVVNIEMQQFWQTSYPRRVAMYLSETVARFLSLHPKHNEPLYAISFTVFGENVPEKIQLPTGSKDSGFELFYLELNKEIAYTMNKHINNYTAKDYWIRFLANYKNDTKTDELETLCKLNQGVNMANEVLLTVTEEERRIAREISENNYQRMLKFESEIAREKGYNKGHTEGRAEGHAEGYAEGHSKGYAEGISEGELKKARETALTFKKIGLPISQIAKGTGLTEEEIKEL